MAWSEKDKKVYEYQEQLEKEREVSKWKIQDLETKVKESDFAKNTQVFEFEKEKVKWTLEREWLNQAIADLKEKCEKNDQDSKKIKTELERLKWVKQTA